MIVSPELISIGKSVADELDVPQDTVMVAECARATMPTSTKRGRGMV